MVQTTVNPDATLIPDKAEVWLALKSNVTNITSMIPSTVDADLAALGWEFSGLVDDKKGIPLNPGIEVKPYNAFGHSRFRVKLKKGTLTSGFTALEYNSVTRKIVLPGSAANKIGIPKDVQIYVLYRYLDEDVSGGSGVWVSLTPAPVELKSHGGIVDGELSFAELVVHHTADANGDVFQTVGGLPLTKTITLGSGVTAYMVLVDGQPTSLISTLTAAALQTALRALANVGSSGVTVTGSGSGPFTAVFTAPVLNVTAAGTGGTVTVS
jgi:hypothetical protein